MDDAELTALEQGIRAMLTELGLDWVRTNIEEGITAGIHKEVLIRRSQHRDEPASLFDDEGEFRYPEPLTIKGGQRMIGNLRLSPVDRMRLIMQALRRLIVELPEIHEDAVRRLAPGDDHDTAAEELRFVPEEDDGTQPPPSLEVVTAQGAREARLAASAFLTLLEGEVARP